MTASEKRRFSQWHEQMIGKLNYPTSVLNELRQARDNWLVTIRTLPEEPGAVQKVLDSLIATEAAIRLMGWTHAADEVADVYRTLKASGLA